MARPSTSPPVAAPNLREYTVGEIARQVKRTVEGAFERVRVRGEISGLTKAASGHLYLSLKDASAAIDTVVWRTTAGRLGVRPEDGMEVVCEGRLSTYAPRSRYQLIVDSMAVAGVGALLALLEERRRKLAAEGLFDDSRKRPIPFLSEVVGVVTSPSGAALRDVLRRLEDRFPRPVWVWPARVQGEGAAAEIARAIAGFNRLEAGGAPPRPDVLIVARGGGSIEDLWAFNEEAVVRAAAASEIPLISGVGHETDTTLIDHAADWRAPTPTAAAEKAAPVRAELTVDLLDRARRLAAGFARGVADRRRTVAGLARGLPRPRRLIGEAAQRLDDRANGLARAAALQCERRRAALAAAGHRIGAPTARVGAADSRMRLAAHALRAAAAMRNAAAQRALERLAGNERLSAAARRVVADRRRRLEALAPRLESVSHRNVLARGYAVVRGAAGLLRDAEAARRAGRFAIRFHDGDVDARVAGAARTQRGESGQDRLL